MKRIAVLVVLAMVCLSGPAPRADEPAAAVGQDSAPDMLLSAFAQNCVKCHGANGEPEGDVNLFELKTADDLLARPALVQDNKESIYFDNMSWYGTGHVAPSLRDPRKAYQRMFGTQEIDAYRDITDLVLEDAQSMQRKLGQGDRQKFAEYFDGIRTLEQQMDKLEAMKVELASVSIDEPLEAHLPRGEYIRLMGDLMVAALQTGLTNVATMMIGPERWDSPLRYETLFDKPMSHHVMSHDQKRFVNQLLQVDRFHMEQFAYLVERMDGIQEQDGSSLLDNTIFTYGSGLGDGATHQYTELPIIVAGSGGGRLRTGQHLHCADGTPLANLWLTHAQVMGLKHERFADSTAAIQQLLS